MEIVKIALEIKMVNILQEVKDEKNKQSNNS